MMAGMMLGQHRIKMVLLLALLVEVVLGASLASGGDRYGPKFEYGGRDDGHHFVTFNYGNDGVYKFAFTLPDQSRQEERNEEGEVRGSYSFIDPEGEEFSLEYLADKRGFQPVADHLPVAPEETDDVKEARKAFAEFYEETVKYLEALSSKEGSDEDGRRPYKSPSRDQDAAGSYQSSSSLAQSLGGSYGTRGGYQAPRLGDIEGDDDDDEEDSSSESEEDDNKNDDDDEGSSEEDGANDDGEDSSEEEGEDGDEGDDEKEEEEGDKRGSTRGDRGDRKKGRKDEKDEEEGDDEEKEKEENKEQEIKSSSRKEGGRNDRIFRKGPRNGRRSDN